MSDQYVLEGDVDGYLIEDGTGVLLIDQRVEVKNDTVELSESQNNSWLKVIVENFGVSDAVNTGFGFVKNAVQEILGLTDSGINTKITEFEYLLEDADTDFDAYELEDSTGVYLQDYPLKASSDTVGITEASQNNKGFLKNIAEVVGLTDATPEWIKGISKTVTQFIVAVEDVFNTLLEEINFYFLEDGSGRYIREDGTGGRYLIEALEILKQADEVLGITEASQRLLGPIKVISDIVNIVENKVRKLSLLRNTTSETIGVTETKNRIGAWIRNIGETIGVTETVNRLGIIKRNISDTLNLTENSIWVRGLRKILNDIVGVTESSNITTGIVQVLQEILGLTELVNRIRTVFISKDFGDFIITDSYNAEDFIVMDSMDIGDIVVIDSYNFGDFNIIDDN